MEKSTAELGNIHLRHSMLAGLHSMLKNYMMCMDRNYFGPRSNQEIELTKKLHEVKETYGLEYQENFSIGVREIAKRLKTHLPIPSNLM